MFGSMMGFDMGLDEDDLFGNPFRQMNNMMNSMNSMFANPFGGMLGQNMLGQNMLGQNMLMEHPHAPQQRQRHRNEMNMMPFGNMFGGMQQLMSQMGGNPNCHSFSSSSVMTMTSGPDGRPQVYQASSSTRQGPGGVRETKKSVCDSRAGIKKMQIGHHIGERAHVIEREQDLRSGQQEENQEFINLEEDEAESFNREWVQKTQRYSRRGHNAIGYGSPRHHRHSANGPQLALPSSTSQRDRSPEDEHDEHDFHQGGVEITEVTEEEPDEREETEIHEPTNILEPGDLRRKRDHDDEDVPARKAKKPAKKQK